jgi:hypothetical protein
MAALAADEEKVITTTTEVRVTGIVAVQVSRTVRDEEKII